MNLDTLPTAAAFGRLVGISRQRAATLRDSGVITGDTLAEWIASYCANLRAKAGGHDPGNGPLNLAQERAALAEAQRLKLEREVKIASGELDSVRAMEHDFAQAIIAIRGAMEAWPGKVAAIGAGLDDRALCILLDREMRAELTRVADVQPDGAPVNNPFRNRKPRRKQ